jgi:hypothetical protein
MVFHRRPSARGTPCAVLPIMGAHSWLGVTSRQAFQFFFEHLRDVTNTADTPTNELLYNASVLAHFASTSTASDDTFPSTPASLVTVFNLFVMDRSMVRDPEIMEIAGAQCLLLTGFFQDQQKRRHQVNWYADLGMAFYAGAASAGRDPARSRLMETMARRFDFWRVHQYRLARELREEAQFTTYGLRPPDEPETRV